MGMEPQQQPTPHVDLHPDADPEEMAWVEAVLGALGHRNVIGIVMMQSKERPRHVIAHVAVSWWRRRHFRRQLPAMKAALEKLTEPGARCDVMLMTGDVTFGMKTLQRLQAERYSGAR